MIKKNIEVTINSKTRQVFFEDNFLGIKGENLQGYLVFKFQDEFVNGVATLKVEQEGNKYNIYEVEKENDSYKVIIKSSLLKSPIIYMALSITENGNETEIPIFISNKFFMLVGETIESTEEIPDEYNSWIDIANTKLNQVDNVDIDIATIDDVTKVEITRKDGTKKEAIVSSSNANFDVNIENGQGVNNLQQKFESTSWTTTNKKIKEYIKNDIANGDGGKIIYEDLGNENYSIKVITNGKSAFNQNGKSQTVGGKSHTEGSKNVAFESNSHAEGNETFAGGKHSHSEGNTTSSIGNASHSEGYNTVAIGIASHSEGNETEAKGDFGHSEGTLTHANGSSAHAEGLETVASGLASHTEGGHTEATQNCAHAEGYHTHAIGQYSHSEGCETVAEGGNAHAEGRNTHAEGWESHSEGGSTHAIGGTSHAEGDTTVAIGGASHSEGYHTVAVANHSHVEGRYNVIDENGDYVHIVGNGYYDEVNKKEVRSNAHTIDWSGNGWFAGSVIVNGTDTVATEQYVNEKLVNSNPDIDLSNYAKKTDIPTKTSQLTNDSGFITEHQDLTDYVKNTDYATSSKAGLVRPANGLFTSGNTGALLISKASKEQIDAKTDNYYPIVSSNLEYAVKSVGDGYYAEKEYVDEKLGDIESLLSEV